MADIKNKTRALRILYAVIGIMVAFTLLRSLLRGEYSNVFICILTFVLLSMPIFIEKNFKLKLPTVFEAIVLLFIFSSEILGEINSYYQRIPNWDTILHTINGFMFAALGFALLDIINRNPRIKFKLSPIYLALVAFCFSMTIGVLWEFFEFGWDRIADCDMQKDSYVRDVFTVMLDETNSNTVIRIRDIEKVVIHHTADGVNTTTTLPAYLDIGLIDTMKDLFVNFIGAVVFSLIGYAYLKLGGRGRIAGHFIPTITESEEEKRDSSQSE